MTSSGAAAAASTARVTEMASELSSGIDLATAEEIVRTIRSCDGQMWAGYGGYPAMYDKNVRQAMEALSDVAAEMVAFPKDSAIIISGAGTSGRIAFGVARTFNAMLHRHRLPPCFHYLIAGGDAALLRAQEGAEDNAAQAVEDLERMEKTRGGVGGGRPCSRVLYVGISCGLSATYVAAQLKHSMSKPHHATALIGFNPPSAARTEKPLGASPSAPSFHNAVSELQARMTDASDPLSALRYFFINPVLGPEAVAGSTRLKGGTATKIILETVLARAIAKVLRLPLLGELPGVPRLVVTTPSSDTNPQRQPAKTKARVGWQRAADAPMLPAATVLAAYEATCRAAYLPLDDIASLMRMMATTLQKGGNVYYVGNLGLGLAAVTDASEQVPTFGSRPEAFQAFVAGGWPAARCAFQRVPTTATPSSAAPAPMSNPAGSSSSSGIGRRGDEASNDGNDGSSSSSNGNGAATRGVDGGRIESLDERMSHLSVEEFVFNVLPSARPIDTVVLLESDVTCHGNEPLPRLLFDALLDKIASEGKSISLALLLVTTAPHDRLLATVVDDEALSDDLASVAIGAADGGPPAAAGVSGSSSSNSTDGSGVGSFSQQRAVESIFEDVADVTVRVLLPPPAAAPLLPRGIDAFGEIAVKIVLNAASTGAQVLCGKVFLNRMIDLRISNRKLLKRASEIVAQLAEVDETAAVSAIRQVVFGEGEGNESTGGLSEGGAKDAEVARIVAVAAGLEKVVPAAVLVAAGQYTVEKAKQAAQHAQSIRTLLFEEIRT